MIKTVFYKITLPVFLLFFSILSFANTPTIQFHSAGYGFVKKSTIGVTQRATLSVAARGAVSVAKVFVRVGGVLFQATASPSDQELENNSINLSYKSDGEHNAILNVKIGEKTAISHIPSWIWIPAAKFADSNDTAVLSLYGKPQTEDEKKYHLEKEPRFWVDYHPAIDDTLIGLMIFAVDGMFVDVKPERLRKLTQSFSNEKAYFGDIPRFNEAKSKNASLKIIKILKKKDEFIEEYKKLSKNLEPRVLAFDTEVDQSKKLSMALALKTDIEKLQATETNYKNYQWSTYMMNDVSSNFTFNINNGILNINSVPNYHFGVAEEENFTEAKPVTNNLIKKRELFYDLNPLIYSSVDKFSKIISFFNYIKEKRPEKWKIFMKKINNERFSLPLVDTPAAWNPK